MTHNITFTADGKATHFHLIDRDDDIAIFDLFRTSGCLPEVRLPKADMVEFDRDDVVALALFLSGDCDDFPEPRWSDHDVVRWHNGTRWSTFVRVKDDHWVQVTDEGHALPEWTDVNISRLVDGEMFPGPRDDQQVEVVRQKLA